MENDAFTPSLGSVVNAYRKISVDDYQRTYQWERPQLEEFFSDLIETASQDDHHFFGTLILQGTNEGVNIVDGQQRLTTVFIFVAALRDMIEDLSLNVIEPVSRSAMPVDVRREVWRFLYFEDNFNAHRFESNRFLREMMRDQVIAEPAGRTPLPQRDRQTTLPFRKAVLILKGLLEKDLRDFGSNEEKLVRIYDLFRTLTEKFLVLRVSTRSLDESLEIFLTLNNRGLPLGPSDLVRGEIIRARSLGLSEREQHALNESVFGEWEVVAETVKEPDVFLRHYLVSITDFPVQKKKIVRAVMDQIANQDAEIRKNNARDFWEELLEAAAIYGRIISPNTASRLDYYLMQLEGLIKSHRVVFLTAFRIVNSPDDLEELARVVSALSYRWILAGNNAQELEKFFQKQSTQLREGDDVSNIITAVKAKATEPVFDLPRFLTSEGDSSFVTRALLHSIDRSIAGGAVPINLNNGDLHLEHIAPKSGLDDWKDAVFQGDQDEFVKYESVITAAGNLTLLDAKLNLQAQRKLFDEKKSEYYQHSRMTSITQDLMAFPKWNRQIIEERTVWLAEMFERLWSIDRPDTRAIRFSEWVEGNR
jgi:hypothetical protein